MHTLTVNPRPFALFDVMHDEYGLSDAAIDAVCCGMNGVLCAEASLRRLADDMRRRLDTVNRMVENGQRLNSLGELQSMPREFDMAVRDRELALNDLLSLCHALDLPADVVFVNGE